MPDELQTIALDPMQMSVYSDYTVQCGGRAQNYVVYLYMQFHEKL